MLLSEDMIDDVAQPYCQSLASWPIYPKASKRKRTESVHSEEEASGQHQVLKELRSAGSLKQETYVCRPIL